MWNHKAGFICVALIIASAVLLTGWTNPEPEEYPATDAEALWKFITEKSPYPVLADDAWHFLPGWEGRKPGRAPHGAGIATYVNSIAYQAVEKRATTLPNHSVVVKENYAPAAKGDKQSALWPNAKLAAVTVMYKVAGYNAEANDWYWVKYNPDGTVDEKDGMKIAGKVGSCINCHAAGSGAENDYLIGYDLSAMAPANAKSSRK